MFNTLRCKLKGGHKWIQSGPTQSTRVYEGQIHSDGSASVGTDSPNHLEHRIPQVCEECGAKRVRITTSP